MGHLLRRPRTGCGLLLAALGTEAVLVLEVPEDVVAVYALHGVHGRFSSPSPSPSWDRPWWFPDAFPSSASAVAAGLSVGYWEYQTILVPSWPSLWAWFPFSLVGMVSARVADPSVARDQDGSDTGNGGP